jgi:uncharacterized repeat protein (TIGR01451 family)
VTDGVTLINRGTQVRYTIVVSNIGPNAVTGATVHDNFPNILDTINWTCAAAGGASCGGNANGNGTINRTVNMPVGSVITFSTTSGRLPVDTPVNIITLANTATVTAPAGYLDTNTANNSATDTDTINGVHLSARTATSANTSAAQWSASVIVTVHDANHSPLQNAVVRGTWVSGGSGGGSCTTDASGHCILTRTGISRTSTFGSAALLTITGMTGPGNAGYQFTLNEASATISVSRP